MNQVQIIVKKGAAVKVGNNIKINKRDFVALVSQAGPNSFYYYSGHTLCQLKNTKTEIL